MAVDRTESHAENTVRRMQFKDLKRVLGLYSNRLLRRAGKLLIKAVKTTVLWHKEGYSLT